MKRKAYDSLLNWKNNYQSVTKRKPLAIIGMRGTGKTTLVSEFAEAEFDRYIYVNMQNDGAVRDFLERRLQNSSGAVEDFSVPLLLLEYLGIEPTYIESVLFIIDQPEFSKRIAAHMAIEASEAQYDKISMILVSDYYSEIKPVLEPYIDVIKLHPFSFDEFLCLTGHEWYRDVIIGHFEQMKSIPELIHQDVLELFDDYLSTGGMPAAVNEYLKNSSSSLIPSIHQTIYRDSAYGLSLVCDEQRCFKMNKLLAYEEKLLCKDNPRIVYSEIRRGTSYGYYENALRSLIDSEMLIPVRSLDEPFEKDIITYPVDCGMFSTRVKESNYVDEARLHFIACVCSIVACLHQKDYGVFFWQSNSKARLDILFRNCDGIIVPIELATHEKNQAKSLKSYFNNHPGTERSVRIWNKNFEKGDNVINVPIYAVFCL